MSREIELKVPLSEEQFDRIQKILTQNQLSSIKMHGLSHIFKSDEYFSRYHTHEERIKNKELRVIRIRTEREGQNDGQGEKSFFCIKQKTIENGVEFNSEKETFVEDADVLRAFFEATGYIKWFEKKKDALSVFCSLTSQPDFEAHLELEKVNSLPYIEIEYTKEDLPADQVRAGLEQILLALGVDPKKRDSRSWAEILS
ncbi:MAG: hypothetical protein IJM48_01025 [Treponema sp.]|nr:hypothetical protein [Treponema sp.]